MVCQATAYVLVDQLMVAIIRAAADSLRRCAKLSATPTHISCSHLHKLGAVRYTRANYECMAFLARVFKQLSPIPHLNTVVWAVCCLVPDAPSSKGALSNPVHNTGLEMKRRSYYRDIRTTWQ